MLNEIRVTSPDMNKVIRKIARLAGDEGKGLLRPSLRNSIRVSRKIVRNVTRNMIGGRYGAFMAKNIIASERLRAFKNDKGVKFMNLKIQKSALEKQASLGKGQKTSEAGAYISKLNPNRKKARTYIPFAIYFGHKIWSYGRYLASGGIFHKGYTGKKTKPIRFMEVGAKRAEPDAIKAFDAELVKAVKRALR